MSKESKFLSVLLDVANGRRHKANMEQILIRNSSQLHELLLWLEERSRHNKLFYFPCMKRSKTGNCTVIVKDKTKKDVISQVKFFPLRKEETAENYNRVNGEINMIRELTDDSGKLCTKLPVGEYVVEVSKGSEYEIYETKLIIIENQTAELTCELVPMIDLKKSGWYSGDLHHHSIYSSPVYGGTDPVVESPNEVCRSMMAMGASYGALSDHHNIFNHADWKRLKNKEFIPIIAKEISTSNGHVMALGAEEDVIYKIPKDEERSDECLRREFIRVTDQIKKLNGLPQINHPRDHSKAISWNPAYYDIISIFQTMEIWNGSNPMIEGTTNYDAFLLWLELLVQDRYIPAAAGSDTHNILADDYHIIFNKIKWLGELIKNRQIEIPEQMKPQTALLLELIENDMPIIEKWAETNLSSAGVRTFVHIEGQVTSKKILESLRQGRSFLTNGPVVYCKINGKIPVDKVSLISEDIKINLTILANRPLKHLYIYRNENKAEADNGSGAVSEGQGYRVQHISLNTASSSSGKFDYSRVLSKALLKNVKWMFFIVKDDCTNMAMTNPIFFESIKTI